MDVSKDDFRAWYEPGADGKSKIVVIGEVTEADGSTTTLVRAGQGINPRMLMLKIHIEPHKGPFRLHIAFEKQVRHEEPAEKGAFADLHIESKDGGFTLDVEAVPN